MDLFLIIVAVVVGVLLIGVNFYMLALYCHRILSYILQLMIMALEHPYFVRRLSSSVYL